MFLTAFALVTSVNAQTLDLAKTANKVLTVENVNYNHESSVSSQRFYVDARNFKQWAFNTVDQNDVYLYLPNNVSSTFTNSDYNAYKHHLTLTIDPQKINFGLKIDHQASTGSRNSIKVTKGNWQSERAIEWVINASKLTTQNRTLTVLAIPDDKSGQLIYVVTLEGY